MSTADTGPEPARAPNDVPSAGDLLEAVQEFLTGTLLPAAGDDTRFYIRVSANVLDVVRRELAGADERSARHARALAGLGVADERELAAAIRSGALAYDDPAVRAVVTATVREKLLVAKPGHPGAGLPS
ncbi:hypothetical protein GIS00_18670 [Nakamurella sp. YIM 132087]|uniref:DUF6285 domain-containing protein n=1 Tax=Nakamurella alba TaxID=2665158 RepID=A0A7K1FRU9_9ACTN|nr:DUF6285 domain-containing protein [Nakamurella alba]MTD15963.1 hypothetical protein [Nakamurella alba]